LVIIIDIVTLNTLLIIKWFLIAMLGPLSQFFLLFLKNIQRVFVLMIIKISLEFKIVWVIFSFLISLLIRLNLVMI